MHPHYHTRLPSYTSPSNHDSTTPQLPQITPQFMALKSKRDTKRQYTSVMHFRAPITYKPYYYKPKKDPVSHNHSFTTDQRQLNPPSYSVSPALMALKMMTEQEKLKEAISQTSQADKYLHLLKTHQEATLGMLSEIEQLKESEKEQKYNGLVQRLERLEQTPYSYQYFDPTIRKSDILIRIIEGFPHKHRWETPNQSRIRRKNVTTNKILNETEILKTKEELLSQKQKRAMLLSAIGLEEDKDESTPLPVPQEVPKFNLLSRRLKTLDEIRAKHNRRIKPIQKFRSIAQSIRAWLYLKKYAKENVWKIKKEQESLMSHDIGLHLEIARGWVLGCIRPVILSIFSQPDLNMNIANSRIGIKELAMRCLRLQVRVKGILEALFEGTDNGPKFLALVRFMHRLTSEGRFLPLDYLCRFEKARLEFDPNGRLSKMNEERKKLLIIGFVIHRVLIGKILLFPHKHISSQITDTQAQNLQFIAGVLNQVALTYINDLFPNMQKIEAVEELPMRYKRIDLQPALGEDWMGRMKKICVEWLDKILGLLKVIQQKPMLSNFAS